MIHESIIDLIGNTPLLHLTRFAPDARARLLAKLEYFNPAGSVKDRAALSMIETAEKEGLLRPGATIIEPTSGNTGIGLAAISAYKGYRVILTMPDSMSVERRKLLAAYGAELVLTEGAKGMAGAIEKAVELSREISNSFLPGQFENEANAAAHYKTTGPELWKAAEGNIDIFISCVGTGGTLTGTARYLREKNPVLRVVAVEPFGSPVLSGGRPGAHKLQGIGAGFVPKVLDRGLIDEIITVRDEDAFAAGREIARREGILVGISSGAALHAARTVGLRAEYAEKTIVAVLPDTGERYLSSEMFR